MSENRRASIELEFKWLQTRPETAKNVKNKLFSLMGTYSQATSRVKESMLTDLQKSKSLQALETEFQKQKNAIRELAPSEEMAAKAIRQGAIEANKEMKALNGLTARQKAMKDSLHSMGSAMTKVGFKMGWFAFRTIVVGKMLTNLLIKPLKSGIAVLTDWEKSMESVANTMGMLAASEELSGERKQELIDLMLKLSEEGPKLEGAMGLLNAAFMQVVVDVGSLLAPVLLELADIFIELWDKHGPDVMDMLRELSTEVFPELLDILEELGPVILLELVDGIVIGTKAMADFLVDLKPVIPQLVKLLGIVIPLAPALLAAGTFTFLLAPAITAIGIACQAASFFIGLYATATGTATVATAGLSASMAGVFVILGAIAAAIAITTLALKGFLFLLSLVNPELAKVLEANAAMNEGMRMSMYRTSNMAGGGPRGRVTYGMPENPYNTTMPQQVDIASTVNIESVSSDMDLNVLENMINSALSDEVRRTFY